VVWWWSRGESARWGVMFRAAAGSGHVNDATFGGELVGWLAPFFFVGWGARCERRRRRDCILACVCNYSLMRGAGRRGARLPCNLRRHKEGERMRWCVVCAPRSACRCMTKIK
jgi:hypothetical protein